MSDRVRARSVSDGFAPGARAPSGHFSAEWLALREPVDHRSRSDGLLAPLEAWWRERTGTSGARRRTGRILDLGSGTGSNVRYLAPRLPGAQEWTLVDHDPELLERAGAPVDRDEEGVELHPVVADLGTGGLERVAGTDLVTGSALLDLVSRAWLTDLVERCRSCGTAAYFVLSYSGGLEWTGPDGRSAPGGVADGRVRDAVNAHQLRDKGLGPALGPEAAAVAEALYSGAGYRTRVAPSPWLLGPAEATLALALLDGWTEAALEERPERAAEIEAWERVRRRAVREGAFRLTVHHLDLLALP